MLYLTQLSPMIMLQLIQLILSAGILVAGFFAKRFNMISLLCFLLIPLTTGEQLDLNFTSYLSIFIYFLLGLILLYECNRYIFKSIILNISLFLAIVVYSNSTMIVKNENVAYYLMIGLFLLYLFSTVQINYKLYTFIEPEKHIKENNYGDINHFTRFTYQSILRLRFFYILISYILTVTASILFFAKIFYLFPNEAFNKELSNFTEYVYYSCTTFFTVGYGDVYPLATYSMEIVYREMFLSHILTAIFLPTLFIFFSKYLQQNYDNNFWKLFKQEILLWITNKLFNEKTIRISILTCNRLLWLNPNFLEAYIVKFGIIWSDSICDVNERNINVLKCIDELIYNNKNEVQAYVIAINIYSRLPIEEHIIKEKINEYYFKAIEIDKNYMNTYVFIGIYYYGLGEYYNALSYYDEALKVNQNFDYIYYLKSNCYVKLEQIDKAIECCDKAISIEPLEPRYYLEKGNLLYSQFKFEESIKCYDYVLRFNPFSSKGYVYKGLCLMNLDRIKEADKCYRKAVRIDAKNEEAYNLKGNICSKRDQIRMALKYYDKALKINSSFEDALCNKGQILTELKRYSEAHIFFDKLIEINKVNGSYYYLIGKCFKEQGNLAEAIKNYEIAINLDSNVRNLPFYL